MKLKDAERFAAGQSLPWAQVLEGLPFNEQGLLPAVAQQYDSGEVLMLACMTRQALAETLATGRVWYWSRSRARLWRKGESSGQVQRLKELRLGCDGDSLLLVDQTGPACYPGRRSCFNNAVRGARVDVSSDPLIDPDDLYRS